MDRYTPCGDGVADPVGSENTAALLDSAFATGVGGGFWISFLHRMQTLSFGIMNGDDLTGVYLSAGFMF